MLSVKFLAVDVEMIRDSNAEFKTTYSTLMLT